MSIPTTLGSYPVERELGRGGMGVVYLARDPRLNRLVAIKIVPEALANNPDNMARFEREARLLAAVNHPNIASIYSVEDVNGQRLLVMEYIAGESLADRLRRGPLPVDEALDVARQIAAAVEAAHEGGIVHRDLKPGNVRVTPDGTVKVLDFGLAKGLVTSDAELAQSPTLTYSPTGLGVILGTAGYMSPEQARGKPVDRRADVWAFGCVLFECFTGKKTFEGETVSDTIARILEREPAWTDLPANTPPRVRELLRRCLEKDLKRRQRDMGDVRLEIEEAQATKSSLSRSIDSGPIVVPPARRAMSAPVMTAIALLVGAAAGIGVWKMAGPSASAGDRTPVSLSLTIPSTIRAVNWGFARGTDDLVLVGGVERRPDGSENSNAQLFARRLGSFELTPIAGSEGMFAFVRSPDGRDVVVWKTVSAQSADSHVVRLSVDGTSPPLSIAELDPAWRDAIWLSDGDLLVLTAGATKLLRLPTNGGAPTPPVALDLGGAAGYPRFETEVAGGAGVLLMIESWSARGYQQDIWLLDPATGKANKLVDNGASPWYVASTGHLFFSRGPAVMAVRFDLATKKVIGDPVGIFDGLRTSLWSNGDFSLSEAGHLLFEPGGRLGTDRRLVTVNAAHEVVPFVAETRSYEAALSASHDGKQVAVVIPTPRGTYETWIGASDRPGLRRALSFPNADATSPVWSPNDQWLAFERNGRDKDDGVYVQKADGTGDPRLVWRRASAEESLYTLDWTHDGSAVIIGNGDGSAQKLIAVPVAVSAGVPATPTVLIAKQPVNAVARLSPDGRYLVFQSAETGSEELHLAEISGGAIVGRPQVITSGGGEEARWSADSERVYYRKQPGRLMSVTIERTPALHASAPVLVHDLVALRLDVDNWDILRDGRLIGIERGVGENPTTSFSVVLNWLDLVRGKLPK
jgi:serine/threonine-protein kinase